MSETDIAGAGTNKFRFSGRDRATLFVLLGASFMLSVDFSILNVALPAVGSGVGIPVSDLPWISSAYALPAAGFTLLFGRLGDFFGRRKLFLSGLILLAAASVLGGCSVNAEMLLSARVLQGLAAALAIPAGLALLTTSFGEGPARNRALGLNGALLSGGFTVGALLGGAIVSLLGWRSALLINVPVALVIIAVAPFVIRETQRRVRARLDVAGAITVSTGLLAGIYGVIEKNLISGLIGVVLLITFGLIEFRSANPLAPVRILARRNVRWGNFAGLVIFTMEPAMIFMMTLYLQRILGLAPLETGLIFGIPGLASITAGLMAGRFVGRYGYRKVLTVGLSIQALATVPLLLLGSEHLLLAIIVPALCVGFFAHVTAIVGYTVTSTTGLPDNEQGLASGLMSMTQQVAITIGIPIVSAVAATQGSEMSGIHLALGTIVTITLAGCGLIWFGLRSVPKLIANADISREQQFRDSIPVE